MKVLALEVQLVGSSMGRWEVMLYDKQCQDRPVQQMCFV